MSDSCNSAMRLQEYDGAVPDFQSIYCFFFFFAFKYVLRFFVSYIYGTIIQNFNHTLFFEKISPYVRAVREKHFDTLKPVLTHAHVLIDFYN